jgi:hypothetical protein
LGIQTVNWSFSYFPINWDHYRVIYTTKLRLIDTKRSVLLAEGFCKNIPGYSPGAPTHEQLLGDGAALLKQSLAADGDKCIQDFASNVLSLRPSAIQGNTDQFIQKFRKPQR